MIIDLLLEHVGLGIWYIILISMPIVLTAAGIGLVVGILQAVTQVQEQTIAAAPKILGVFLVIIIGGGLIISIMKDYFVDSIDLATQIVPKEGHFSQAPQNAKVDPYNINKMIEPDKKKPKKSGEPDFKELLAKPLDTVFFKKEKLKTPDTMKPAPPLPDPSIAEEIQNFKNMRNQNNAIKSLPTLDQKSPVIPPIDTPQKLNSKQISSLPSLDEPPTPTEITLATKNKAISKSSKNGAVTGAAAYLTPGGHQSFDYQVKGSAIIVNGESNSAVLSNGAKQSSNKGAIILEAE